MNDRTKALRERRLAAVARMQEIVSRSEAERRDLTGEELANHTAAFDDSEVLRQQIEALTRSADLEREAAEAALPARGGLPGAPDAGGIEERAFSTWLRAGAADLGQAERRALAAGSDPQGGYLLAPQKFSTELLKNIDDAVFIRNRAHIETIGQADSLGVVALESDPDDADWTSELATGREDNALRFGRRELRPHPLAKRIKVSWALLRRSNRPIEALIRERLAYKFAVAQEQAFLIGSGDRRPLGVFTVSKDGIPTARDVATGNTATSITFDGLIEAKYSLKAAYHPRASWTFHRSAVRQLSLLKDSDGQYLWRPSVRDGEPDRILGHPVDMSEYCPHTFTTGQYVGLFCDWSRYWIVDALAIQIRRLVELYAETAQDGFIALLETDGAPVSSEAFARIKLA